jgi:LmbE family N-acetylglucosaminyl deacetylase
MFENCKNILMFFAHPDDETLAAGGTIAKMTDLRKNVHVAISNTGIYARANADENENLKRQLIELQNNCKEALGILGVQPDHIYFGSFSDNQADKHTLLSLIHWLEPLIDTIKPDLVFTHHRFCTNIDHQYCHEAAVVATRPSKNHHISLLCGEIPSSTGYLRPTQWEPNMYISLSEQHVDRKIHAMLTYKGETRPYPHPRSSEVLKAFAQVRGSESYFYYAEAFMINKTFFYSV